MTSARNTGRKGKKNKSLSKKLLGIAPELRHYVFLLPVVCRIDPQPYPAKVELSYEAFPDLGTSV